MVAVIVGIVAVVVGAGVVVVVVAAGYQPFSTTCNGPTAPTRSTQNTHIWGGTSPNTG